MPLLVKYKTKSGVSLGWVFSRFLGKFTLGWFFGYLPGISTTLLHMVVVLNKQTSKQYWSIQHTHTQRWT